MTDKTFDYRLYQPIVEYVGPVKGVEGEMADLYPPSRFSAGRPDRVTTTIDPGSAPGEGGPVVGDTYTFSWDATFSTSQEEEWAIILKKARRRAEPPDEAALKPHFDTLKAYYQAPNPNQSQTVTAVKSVIAVLREMWKE